MKSVLLALALVVAGGLLAGCASTQTKIHEPGRSLQGVERFFVVRNLKDNRSIDRSIVRALQARGFEATSGPITLLPDNAQAVIVYEDRWAWDFSYHLTLLKISARDREGVLPYATSSYQKQVAFSSPVDAITAQVVGELLAAGR